MNTCPVSDGSICWLFRETCSDSCPHGDALQAVVEDFDLVLVAVSREVVEVEPKGGA